MKDPKGLWGLSHSPGWVTDLPLPQPRRLSSAGKLGVEAEGLGGLCHPFTAPTGPRQPSSGPFSPGGPDTVLGNQRYESTGVETFHPNRPRTQRRREGWGEGARG